MKEKEIAEFVKPLYSNKDSMHNFKHILRIKKRVSLYKNDYNNINEQKLIFLIYFHGLKNYVKEHKNEIIRMGFPNDWITALNRHTKNPISIEEKLVSDANLWEAVGKFGVKKSIQVGKERNRTMKDTLKFMYNNIDSIRFYTKKGKEFGNPGIRYIKNFLRDKIN
ncbi:hypothetical protein GOV12_01755 [Candidatus Pacearchaeota archaeon]|nr:hypothetical protein [Candidatus Pacearchaeota archaeon]